MKTYLYIKEHSLTGLKYFGKTTKSDPYKYIGSGTYWLDHINKHGKEHVKTLWVSEPFVDEDSLVEFATFMSEELDIVNSDKWANLIVENGLNSGGGMLGKSHSEESKNKMRKPHILSENHTSWNKGKLFSEETKSKMSASAKGKLKSDAHKKNISNATMGVSKVWLVGKKFKQNKIECPYCMILGGITNMKRYHFDNCKHKDVI